MIRGAIFDIDGVILDTMSVWRELGSRYLARFGIAAEKDLNKTLFSMSMEQGAEYLKQKYRPKTDAGEILEDIKKMLEEFYFFEAEEKAGARELLALLRGAGVPVAAATSSPRTHVTRALERLGLSGYFSAVFTTAEVGESKHSPQIYIDAARYLGTEPGETLVFEDSLYALKTAADAGFYAVGVYDPYGESGREELKKCGKAYLESLADFKNIWETIDR